MAGDEVDRQLTVDVLVGRADLSDTGRERLMTHAAGVAGRAGRSAPCRPVGGVHTGLGQRLLSDLGREPVTAPEHGLETRISFAFVVPARGESDRIDEPLRQAQVSGKLARTPGDRLLMRVEPHPLARS